MIPLLRSSLFTSLAVLAALLFCQAPLAAPDTASGGRLLVEVCGGLFLVGLEGSEESLADGVNLAVFSPDGRQVAFTTTHQVLVVMALESRRPAELVRLPDGAHFGDVVWKPDGSAIAYEAIVSGKSNDLFLIPLSPELGAARHLGRWYQGVSFTPDGSQILHAVNGPPACGLEVLDVAKGRRTLVHEAADVVWDARFSPDGEFIAYRMTIYEPERSEDDVDCTPPTLGLRLYNLAQDKDIPVIINDAPAGWDDVKTFAWSHDSKRVAVTLGTTDCDYPGSAAGVFVTTVDLESQTRVSASDMAFEPVFSPSGDAVAFVDFSESPAKLLRCELAKGRVTLIRRATKERNYYHLLDWR